MIPYKQRGEHKGWQVRLARDEDAAEIQRWLSDPETTRCFPFGEPAEIEESAKRWVELHKERAALVLECEGRPAAIALVYLQTERQLTHQALHILLVAPEIRNQGIGTFLLNELLLWAKEGLGLELIHVEVTMGTPGVEFYRKRGFEIFAQQREWMKEGDELLGRVMLERLL